MTFLLTSFKAYQQERENATNHMSTIGCIYITSSPKDLGTGFFVAP